MSESLTHAHGLLGLAESADKRPLPVAAQYGSALVFVAIATGCGFALDPLIGAANLTLVFVLPVMAAATAFGWGPALVATVASVLAFDFFFTEPRYSLTIASPADIWSAGLLLVIAASVSTIAAQARRREMAARWSTEQAQALQALAHAVIEAAPRDEILAAAAIALNRIFRAPSVIFVHENGGVRADASAGGGAITRAEEEATKGVFETRLPARADTYPYEKSTFDFWPVQTPDALAGVVGVSFLQARRSRPADPGRFIEIVAAYLAIALRSTPL